MMREQIEGLRNYAKDRGVSYADVSRALGISQGMIYQYLEYNSKPYKGFEDDFRRACDLISGNGKDKNEVKCPRKDCSFCNSLKMSCRILHSGYGKGNKNCRWFQTPEQLRKGREHAERLNNERGIVNHTPIDIGDELMNKNKIDDKVFRAYLESRGKGNTRHDYTPPLNRFSEWLKAKEIEKPQPEDIKEYKDELKKANLSGSTKKRYLAVVRSFFKWTGQNWIYPNVYRSNIRIEE